MRNHLASSAFALSLLALGTGCGAAAPPPKAPHVLPLRSIKFYDTGVGYFERSGALADDEPTLPVPASHLDDALKTLVVIGPDAAVSGLSFDSSPSSGMARARARLPVDPNASMGFRDVLRAAKGERVEVISSTGTMRGRLVDVVDAPVSPTTGPAGGKADESKKDAEEELFSVVVVGDDGAIARVLSRDLRTVRPLDSAFAARVGEALDASGSRAAQVKRFLRVAARGKGNVTLGYVTETPLWRASYRLVLANNGKAALQGWALVHNDTDEDWTKIGVSFVNGRPDSFLFPMAAPRYGRRALVHPDERLSTVPQLLEKTPDAMWGDNTDEIGESYGMGGLGTVGHGSGGGGSGYGYGSGSGRIGGPVVSDLLEIGNLASLAPASGIEAGALFSYNPNSPLDLGAHASALVPFVTRPIGAESITYLSSPSDGPRTALRFVNDSEQTLPPGTISIFSNGGFSGESALDRLKPGERRFVTYGADLDVDLTPSHHELEDVPKRATFDREHLEEHFVRTTKVTWTLKNRGGQARNVYVELALANNSKVEGADALDYDTGTSRPIAIVKMTAASKVEKHIVTTEGLERRISLAALTVEKLTALRDAPGLPSNEKSALSDAATRQKELVDLRAKLEDANKDRGNIEKDLERLREHLKALGDKGAGANPLLTRILAAEDALTAAKKKAAALELDVKAKAESVKDALGKLSRR